MFDADLSNTVTFEEFLKGLKNASASLDEVTRCACMGERWRERGWQGREVPCVCCRYQYCTATRTRIRTRPPQKRVLRHPTAPPLPPPYPPPPTPPCSGTSSGTSSVLEVLNRAARALSSDLDTFWAVYAKHDRVGAGTLDIKTLSRFFKDLFKVGPAS
jgi:hypothetical protein